MVALFVGGPFGGGTRSETATAAALTGDVEGTHEIDTGTRHSTAAAFCIGCAILTLVGLYRRYVHLG